MMFNKYNTDRAVKLLQSRPDGSYVNTWARDNAKRYLSAYIEFLWTWANKNPYTNCAYHLYTMIANYQNIINNS